MSSLKAAVERVASLKPLVVAGAARAAGVVAAGVDLVEGSRVLTVMASLALAGVAIGTPVALGLSAAHAGTAVAEVAVEVAARRAAGAILARTEASSGRLESLRHGLRAIAFADLSRLGPVASSETMRDMARATLAGSPFAPPGNEASAAEGRLFAKSGMTGVDADLAARTARELASVDARYGGSAREAMRNYVRADVASDRTLVEDRAIRTELRALADAVDATPGSMQASARETVRRLGGTGKVVGTDPEYAVSALARMKRYALEDVARIAAEASSPGVDEELSRSRIADVTASVRTHPSDAVLLRAIAAKAGGAEAEALVAEIRDLDLAEAALARVSEALASRRADLASVGAIARAGVLVDGRFERAMERVPDTMASNAAGR